MIFNEEHLVIIESLSKPEARAFVKFLQSEIIRHESDIEQAESLILRVKRDILHLTTYSSVVV
jgi:hypothetical protein